MVPALFVAAAIFTLLGWSVRAARQPLRGPFRGTYKWYQRHLEQSLPLKIKRFVNRRYNSTAFLEVSAQDRRMAADILMVLGAILVFISATIRLFS